MDNYLEVIERLFFVWSAIFDFSVQYWPKAIARKQYWHEREARQLILLEGGRLSQYCNHESNMDGHTQKAIL